MLECLVKVWLKVGLAGEGEKGQESGVVEHLSKNELVPVPQLVDPIAICTSVISFYIALFIPAWVFLFQAMY